MSSARLSRPTDSIADNDSLNLSQSSLQKPSAAVFKNIHINRQTSNNSPSVQNPVYSGPVTNLSQRFFSTVDLRGSTMNLAEKSAQQNKVQLNAVRIEKRKIVLFYFRFDRFAD